MIYLKSSVLKFLNIFGDLNLNSGFDEFKRTFPVNRDAFFI